MRSQWEQGGEKIKKNLFVPTEADPCIYLKRTKSGTAILGLYVDDILVAARDPKLRDTIKLMIKERFPTKDLGVASRVLGLQVSFSDAGILVSQQSYIRDMMAIVGLNAESIKVDTPIATAAYTPDPKKEFVDGTLYRRAVGKLMYAMVGTRPDIAFAVGCVSRFMSKPNPEQWTAVKRIFRYLKGTESAAILYKWGVGGDLTLSGYSDSDWASDVADRKSTAGYVFLLSGGPISWCSKKQPTVALSTTEAEYMASCMANREAVWLRRLLENLGYPQKSATTIFEDNRGCIDLSKNPVSHFRTKHIDIRHHFVREKTLAGEVALTFCPGQHMAADILTKALPRPRFTELRNMLVQCPSAERH
jgi:hypothetical protein